MTEPTLSKRPSYKLLKQTDVVSFFHMQMPRWLFCDKRYIHLSLETKVAYTFLLNRFQLSRMNGWVNSDGEVFIIFPREKLAEEIGISYRKAIDCFKELLSANLIWEHRIGRGSANHIYLAAVELSDEAARTHNSAPFTRSADIAGLDCDESCADAPAPAQDMPESHALTCENSTSEAANTAHPDMQFSHSNKKDNNKKEISENEKVSQSVSARDAADEEQLAEILENSELYILSEEDVGVFRNAIIRLFYCESFRVGNSVLPPQEVRRQLSHLNGLIVLDTREKLRQNKDKLIKNSTAYVMTTLFNNIWEHRSDLMVDPMLNSM